MENISVLYFVEQPVHTYPPCCAEIFEMRDRGYEVAVLTMGCSDEMKHLFEERGIHLQTYSYLNYKNKMFQKVMNYFFYRKLFNDFFRKYGNENSFLWVGTEQSIIRRWHFLKNRHPMVVNCLEFYEVDWYQNGMKKIVDQIDILTACEPHRAQYMVDWWGVKYPYILRNKPYQKPPVRYCEGSIDATKEAIEKIRGKKVLLYQGVIHPERNLGTLASALQQMDSDYYLVLCGRNDHNSVEELQNQYDKVIYLGNFSAPYHLEVTSHATIGIAFYIDDSINNRYCAPNKIYEYAGCGVPMLCNQIPGLTETVGKAKAGECIDFNDIDQVKQAIQTITDHYEEYSHSALRFYQETDNTDTLNAIIDDVKTRLKREDK